MPKTRRKRSAAWKYFKLLDGKAICQITSCGTELTWHGSTTALNAHLQSRHSEVNAALVENIQSPPDSGSKTSFPVSPVTSNYGETSYCVGVQDIDDSICHWIQTAGRSTSIVDDHGFRNLLAMLEPSYRPPSSQSLFLMLNAKYVAVKDSLKRQLERACQTSKLSLSVSSVKDSRHWLYLAVDYISEKWEVKSHVIGVTAYNKTRSCAAIACWMNEKLQDLGIHKSSVLAIVHNNEYGVVIAAKMLSNTLGCHCILSATCALYSVIETAYQQIDLNETVAKVRNALSFFKQHRIGSFLCRRSIFGVPDIAHEQAANIPSIKESICQGVDIQSQPCSSCTDDQENPTWELIQALVEIFQPLEAAIAYFSGEDFVSVSSTPVLLAGLMKKLTAELETKPAIACQNYESYEARSNVGFLKVRLKANLLESMNEVGRFGPNDVCVTAAALDPRFKKLNFLDLNDRQNVYAAISNECFQLSKEEYQKSADTEASSTRQSMLETNTGSSMVDMLLKLGSECSPMEDNAHQTICDDNLRSKIKTEIENYLLEQQSSSDFSPLQWWSANKAKYPLLTSVARTYLCIPASADNFIRKFTKENARKVDFDNFQSGDVDRAAFMHFNGSLVNMS
ncbi:E3 SUMO-protein ligase ZBED1-like [Clavelina lepadiformis]|uniref:E3 SUMO-protein ligase ZBED1-like n=1 Tax=Clavelina lepadiformis TaxID=159417 RepID=UPI004041E36F